VITGRMMSCQQQEPVLGHTAGSLHSGPGCCRGGGEPQVQQGRLCSDNVVSAVFDRMTGKAGILMPLQLDSYQQWDSLSRGCLLGESGDGFGAWSVHDG